MQPRAGTARHDAVNWGYARAADRLGVDIIQNCEVTDFIHENGAVVGVNTSRGEIRAEKIGMAVAGSTSTLAGKAGLGKLPLETHKLQAFVSEPLKPLIDHVIVYGYGHGHYYISQSDKGGLVFGGDLDMYNSYAQKGNLPIYQDVMGCTMNILPMAGRIKVLRQWAGIMDMSMDGSPFISEDGRAGPLSERRLVLWRVQGDPGVWLVLCPHDREGQAARGEPAADAGPVCRRPPDRRDRRRPCAEAPLTPVSPRGAAGRYAHRRSVCPAALAGTRGRSTAADPGNGGRACR